MHLRSPAHEKAKVFVSGHGSRVEVTGKHGGVYTIIWDWFEEGACVESAPSFNGDLRDPRINAHCKCCGDFDVALREEVSCA